MAEDLMTKSKTALARQVDRLKSAARRDGASMEAFGTKVADTLGNGTAWATAALVGVVEGRFRNKDGSPLSLGPVPLPLLGVAGLTGLAWFWNPAGQVSYASAGLAGYHGGTMGRGWGTAWRAKRGVEGVGEADDDLTPEEAALVFQD